jgi:hypothetical protein
MHSHENEPTRKSNRATLARVKKEMDIPRMTESAREEEEKSQLEHAGVGKVAIIQRGKESHVACARVNHGKTNHCNSKVTPRHMQSE